MVAVSDISLKGPDMKLPADMQSFLRNGTNKEMLFNLIEVELKEGKKKVGDKVIYFLNVNHCLKITRSFRCYRKIELL